MKKPAHKGNPKRGTPAYFAAKERREREQKKIIRYTRLVDGWWDFLLECGHGGRMLLGDHWPSGFEKTACNPCSHAQPYSAGRG